MTILKNNLSEVQSKVPKAWYVLIPTEEYEDVAKELFNWMADKIKNVSGIDIRTDASANQRVLNAYEKAIRGSPADIKEFQIKVPYFTGRCRGT